VHEHERRDAIVSGPADDIAKAGSEPLELPFLEPGESRFALRRH
jgi:hypothetical protein